jgi:hypothetical protein
VILSIATGMAVPYIARSYRAAKLRTAARSVIMAGRYARSTAVLHQVQTAILFDLAKHQLEVVSLEDQSGAADRDRFLDARGQRGSDNDDEAEKLSVVSKLSRQLPEGVKIVSVISETVTFEYDDIFWVNYYPNGMCDDYAVRLMDEDRKMVRLDMDPLSGRTAIEYE